MSGGTRGKRDTIREMWPKTFYYLDQTQVKDLYEEVFQEPEPMEIETQETESAEKGIEGRIRHLAQIASKYEKVKSSHVKKKYEVRVSTATMYNKVETYLFDHGPVLFSLEDFEYDSSSIDEFRATCSQMKDKFEFDVSDELQKKFVADKVHGFALQTIEAMSKASGYVAVQSEFAVCRVSEKFIFTLEHPLNKYLRPDETKVAIEIQCNNESLTPSGKTVLAEGTCVKIASLGKIVRWDSGQNTLVINPIAIY